ncbi:radical SAM protein [bacterium]|nr:radical SAM protein [bacterium]
MKYEGPIYRPPSEANSLLIQATIGCPHNRCTFCLVYKNGPEYRVRDVVEIKREIDEAAEDHGFQIQTLFFPSGNTIAMDTRQLAEICRHARKKFPNLERITVYGSSQYIHQKGLKALQYLADSGLSRIHVGLESGDDKILRKIRKGCLSEKQVQAGKWVIESGMELSLYVILGIGGLEGSEAHALATARALNQIEPHFIRLRTFVPKVNTPLLEDVQKGVFKMLGPHGVLRETKTLVANLTCNSYLTSDHYTNYINVEGRLPEDRERVISKIDLALSKDENRFRSFFIGDQ